MRAAPNAPLLRKHVPCRKCDRGVLVAADAGFYPTAIRCAACRQALSVQDSPLGSWSNTA